MDFVIGNGNGFEEKDVIAAIQKLDCESKVKIAEVIARDLVALIDKGTNALATEEDKEDCIVAERSLKEIMQTIVSLISNKG